MGGWLVYVLVSSKSARTYVGITNDLERRIAQHNGEVPGGARSTRAGRPWRVGALYGVFESRGRAQAAEYQIKQLAGRARLAAPVQRPAPLELG